MYMKQDTAVVKRDMEFFYVRCVPLRPRRELCARKRSSEACKRHCGGLHTSPERREQFMILRARRFAVIAASVFFPAHFSRPMRGIVMIHRVTVYGGLLDKKRQIQNSKGYYYTT